ncbi:hypothetical protein [Sinomonas humi]|uniref:Lipoprotein n=1 Tax=Sinomonas humi TaxID=1338436 RepID=A0A0B2AIM0_9MICC|nr:hypothetical protein [Sinomonas humi]KHL01597.1 hypothetical protein LK10_15225 [Sinomonas humi]
MVRRRALPGTVPARGGLFGAAVLFTVAALAGCGLGPKPTPSLDQLRSDSVTSVQYPSAALVGTAAADSNNDFGPNSAFLDRTWATRGQASAVFAFFDRKLVSLGWTRHDGAGVGTTSWSDAQTWTLGKRIYEVAIDARDHAGRVAALHPDVVATTDTVFETLQE